MIARNAMVAIFITSALVAQQGGSPLPAPPQPPALPVIEQNGCPLHHVGTKFIQDEISVRDELHSEPNRNSPIVAVVHHGDEVTILSGVYVTREPDIAELLRDLEEPKWKKGERVFRYGFDGGGYWHFWAHGEWWKEYYENVVGKDGHCGFADKSQCSVVVVKNGVREWWLHAQTKDQRSGWIIAAYVEHDASSDDPNFEEWCMD